MLELNVRHTSFKFVQYWDWSLAMSLLTALEFCNYKPDLFHHLIRILNLLHIINSCRNVFDFKPDLFDRLLHSILGNLCCCVTLLTVY